MKMAVFIDVEHPIFRQDDVPWMKPLTLT
ncbi:hypothetical protein GBAR_LOCUS28382 [Geodia barretti]|uniref:Uncharacterized protein n=1 Tax=Geodia barretti TaxID=519541 RepID=A0AA35TQB5_GEOBA|nr:hypothetical protein GBAR_LOCUS28382 [Geodia barretti]